MACKDQSREIEGHSVFCRQWPATKALQMKAKLINMCGDLALPFVEGVADIRSMIALYKTAEPETLSEVIKQFVCEVRVDGEEVTPMTFDIKYRGDLWFMMKVFTFACEVQYKDFFENGLQELQQ